MPPDSESSPVAGFQRVVAAVAVQAVVAVAADEAVGPNAPAEDVAAAAALEAVVGAVAVQQVAPAAADEAVAELVPRSTRRRWSRPSGCHAGTAADGAGGGATLGGVSVVAALAGVVAGDVVERPARDRRAARRGRPRHAAATVTLTSALSPRRVARCCRWPRCTHRPPPTRTRGVPTPRSRRCRVLCWGRCWRRGRCVHRLSDDPPLRRAGGRDRQRRGTRSGLARDLRGHSSWVSSHEPVAVAVGLHVGLQQQAARERDVGRARGRRARRTPPARRRPQGRARRGDLRSVRRQRVTAAISIR